VIDLVPSLSLGETVLARTSHVSVYVHVCVYACVCICMCVCMYVCMYVLRGYNPQSDRFSPFSFPGRDCIGKNFSRKCVMCMCVYMHVCVYVCVCVCMYVCMC